MTKLHDLYAPSRARAPGSTTSGGAGSPAASCSALGRARASGASPRTRRSSRRRCRLGDDYDEQFGRPGRRRHVGRRRLLGPGRRTTSRTPSASCARSTTPATASTASCRSRWRPALARDTDGTIAAARELHERIAEPNLYVKIPGTAEGLPAIRQMIAEGRSINVTLLFCLDRYDEVIEAYLSGLEAYDGDLVPRQQRGVVLRQPGRHRGRPPPRGHRHARGAGPAGQGRRGQRPAGLPALPRARSRARAGRRWPPGAPGCSGRCGRRPRPRTRRTPTRSTSTRLIGPDTVNTHARRHPRGLRRPRHRWPAPSTPTPTAAEAVLAAARRASASTSTTWPGVLEDEGVASFAKTFDELLGTLGAKAEQLRSA